MQCRDAQFYLKLRRHAGDELDAPVSADLDRHIAVCPACAVDAKATASFDRAVTTAMKFIPVPAGLRDKLLTQASAQRGAAIRRTAYQVAALAASLFVGVGLTFGVFSASRPKLDTASLVDKTDEQVQNPDEAVRRWLLANKLPAKLPHDFDTALLISLGTERLQGRDVPVMVFGRPNTPEFADNKVGFAKVYIVRTDGEFDTRGMQDNAASNTVAVVIDDQRQFRGAKYVILYTSNPRGLEPFLRPKTGSLARL